MAHDNVRVRMAAAAGPVAGVWRRAGAERQGAVIAGGAAVVELPQGKTDKISLLRSSIMR